MRPAPSAEKLVICTGAGFRGGLLEGGAEGGGEGGGAFAKLADCEERLVICTGAGFRVSGGVGSGMYLGWLSLAGLGEFSPVSRCKPRVRLGLDVRLKRSRGSISKWCRRAAAAASRATSNRKSQNHGKPEPESVVRCVDGAAGAAVVVSAGADVVSPTSSKAGVAPSSPSKQFGLSPKYTREPSIPVTLMYATAPSSACTP